MAGGCSLVERNLMKQTLNRRYPIAAAIRRACNELQVSEARVLARVGLSPEFLRDEGRGVDGCSFYNLWRAFEVEANRPDLPLLLGRGATRGPFTPALIAFSCSPNLEIGVQRLAVFKPIIGPVALGIRRDGDSVIIDIGSSEPDAPMPASMSTFEAIFFVESARVFTGVNIVPIRIDLPDARFATDALRAFVAGPIDHHEHARLVFNVEDASRPFISEDTAFWEVMEGELMRRLIDGQEGGAVAARVRNVLMATLASGDSSIDKICRRLKMSRRTLQRQLKQEGFCYQTILDETRIEMSRIYLRRGDMSAEEISHLLAFRDPNSFYRAFRGWTGMTPAEARDAALTFPEARLQGAENS